MGKLKNKLIDEQDAKIIEAEKQRERVRLQAVQCNDPKMIEWLDSVNRAEAMYNARMGRSGVRWTGD
jgi:hypothetical protein